MSTRAQRKKANLQAQPQAAKKTTDKAKKAAVTKNKSVAKSGDSNTTQAAPTAASKPEAAAQAVSAPAADKSKKVKVLAPGERLGDRIVDASFLAGAAQRDQFPPPAFSEIAFAGRSNVGKSSLMNCLTSRRNLVRTSSTPGCTRQVAWFRTVADDKSIIDMVDLPGYGYAKRSKHERNHWANLIGDYLLGRVTLRGVVLLIDVRRGIEEDDLELIKMLTEEPQVSRPALEIVVVATKLDKLSPTQQKTAVAQMTKQLGRPVLGFSAHAGLGRVELLRQLRRIANVGLAELDPTPAAATDAPPLPADERSTIEQPAAEQATMEA